MGWILPSFSVKHLPCFIEDERILQIVERDSAGGRDGLIRTFLLVLSVCDVDDGRAGGRRRPQGRWWPQGARSQLPAGSSGSPSLGHPCEGRGLCGLFYLFTGLLPGLSQEGVFWGFLSSGNDAGEFGNI